MQLVTVPLIPKTRSCVWIQRFRFLDLLCGIYLSAVRRMSIGSLMNRNARHGCLPVMAEPTSNWLVVVGSSEIGVVEFLTTRDCYQEIGSKVRDQGKTYTTTFHSTHLINLEPADAIRLT